MRTVSCKYIIHFKSFVFLRGVMAWRMHNAYNTLENSHILSTY